MIFSGCMMENVEIVGRKGESAFSPVFFYLGLASRMDRNG
jgi:hypothetical protein